MAGSVVARARSGEEDANDCAVWRREAWEVAGVCTWEVGEIEGREVVHVLSIIGRGERPEVECVLFGFVPCWLERGVAAGLGDDEKVDKWLGAHGRFMRDWFWKQWKAFKEVG